MGQGRDEQTGGDLPSDASLGTLQRLLLTTDGTVVQLLEAWFNDRVELAGHEQHTTPVGETDGDLEPAGDETILRRRVCLVGRRTGSRYVYAETSIVLDRLDEAVREGLLTTSEPIGRLLRAHRIETFKEVVRTGRRPAGSLAGPLGIDSADDLLFRVFRVVTAGRPVMLIAEHFPARLPSPDAGRRTVVLTDVDLADAQRSAS